MQAYYSVLSYRLANGEFPALDCTEHLPPSRYMALASESTRRAGDEQMADVMRELAYRVDTGWEDQRQRGFCAYGQAVWYLESGDTEAARTAFTIATDSLQQTHLPNDQPAVSAISQSYLTLGDIAAAKEDWDSAIQEYRRSILVSPKDARRSLRALVRIWQQRGDDADGMLQQLEEMRTSHGADNPFLISEPVLALLDAGMVDAARQLLGSAPRELSGAVVVLRARGMLHETAGEMESARQAYSTALSGALQGEPAAAAELAADLARVEGALGHSSEAISNLEVAVRLNPGSPSYWVQLARSYEQAGDLENMRRTLEAGLSLHPQDSTLRKALDELMETGK